MKAIKLFSIVPQSIQECDILVEGVKSVIIGAKEDNNYTLVQQAQQVLDVCVEVKQAMAEAKKSLVVINPYSHTESEPKPTEQIKIRKALNGEQI
jgi:hypothetical protein